MSDETPAVDPAAEQADAPVAVPPAGKFALEVTYKGDASAEDMAAALPWVQQTSAGLDSLDSDMPACIDAITVRRN